MNVCANTALKGTSMCYKVHSPLWCKCYIVLMIPHLTFLEGSVDDKNFYFVLSFCLSILFNRNIWDFSNEIFCHDEWKECK